MSLHIIPINDLKTHTEVGSQCECKPSVKIENGEIIVIHNSFDGREGVEWVNEFLKQPPNTNQ